MKRRHVFIETSLLDYQFAIHLFYNELEYSFLDFDRHLGSQIGPLKPGVDRCDSVAIYVDDSTQQGWDHAGIVNMTGTEDGQSFIGIIHDSLAEDGKLVFYGLQGKDEDGREIIDHLESWTKSELSMVIDDSYAEGKSEADIKIEESGSDMDMMMNEVPETDDLQQEFLAQANKAADVANTQDNPDSTVSGADGFITHSGGTVLFDPLNNASGSAVRSVSKDFRAQWLQENMTLLSEIGWIGHGTDDIENSVHNLEHLNKISSATLQLIVNIATETPIALNNLNGDATVLRADDVILVDIIVSPDFSDEKLQDLEALGLINPSRYVNLVSGRVAVSDIYNLVSEEAVLSLRYSPYVAHAGIVGSRAEVALRSDLLNDIGYTGEGIQIGVLSDSYNYRRSDMPNADADIASGDLPDGIVDIDDIDPHYPFEKEEDRPKDEGRAMLQIIHDIVPDSALSFATAWWDLLDFANNIRALAANGADVIVDDILYLNQLTFVDDILNQAIDDVVSDGVVYLTANGNYGMQGVIEGSDVYRSTTLDGLSFNLLDFNPSTETIDLLSFQAESTGSIDLRLTWSSPAFSVHDVFASSDLNLYVFNSDLTTMLASSEDDQETIAYDPIELIKMDVEAGQTYTVAVAHRSGAIPEYVQVNSLGSDVTYSADGLDEYSSVFGHPLSAGAISVGAVYYEESPSGGEDGRVKVEEFSSYGKGYLTHDESGNPLPTPEIRIGAEIAGVDGLNTTFFGPSGDTDGDGNPNFYGTSAAAPSVAAVVAMMLENNPALTRDDILNILQDTAIDAESYYNESDFDPVSGAGLVDAIGAIVRIEGKGEFQVDTNPNDPGLSLVSGLNDGDYVVIWKAYEPDDSGTGIYGQRYAADGAKDGNEFLVDSTTRASPLSLGNPEVASLQDGGFVVIWPFAIREESTQTYQSGIYGQRYAADGSPAGSQFQVTTYGGSPSVTGLQDGGFVVITYSGGDGLYGQRYTSNGTPVGSVFLVDERGSHASVAGLSDGGFVVTWQEWMGEYYTDIFGQRYAADGTPVGSVFLVNTNRDFRQDEASVTGLSDGGFVVTWTSGLLSREDQGIYGQRYAADGAKDGHEFLVNTPIDGIQTDSSVTGLIEAGFVVTWDSDRLDGSGQDIYGQRFSTHAMRVGSEFQVNTHTTGDQLLPSVAGLQDNGFVVTWTSVPLSDNSDVYGQRFILDNLVTEGTAGNDSLAGTDDDDIIYGYEGNDILIGKAGNDRIFGGYNNDKLYGEEGVDMLNGGEGNDTLDGGDGFDTAAFSGAFSEYQISYDAVSGVFTISDSIAQRDGVDEVVDIEIFAFDDGDYEAFPPTQNHPPTITHFSGSVKTTDEETEVEISSADLAAAGDETDTDGTVEGFVVKSVSSGTLRIGPNAGSATAYNAVTNCQIDATNHAYWTPDTDANGELPAFSVVAVDDEGAESSPPIEATVSVNAVNDVPQGSVTINGTAVQGETLTADATGIVDTDGLGVFSYQWRADDVDITGATESVYTLKESDVGKTITVRVSYTDLHGTAESVTSDPTSAVVNVNEEVMMRNGEALGVEEYTGPATGAGGQPLDYEYIGDDSNEVLIGTDSNDFINVMGGFDAVDAGAGNDVIDGGTGSNFLTGGEGTDIFFSDGRGGQTTWSTITDWEQGEQLSVWGWQPGTSQVVAWVQAGAPGYEGLTMHADLNGDAVIETSVTFTGILSQSELPTPLEFDGVLWFV